MERSKKAFQGLFQKRSLKKQIDRDESGQGKVCKLCPNSIVKDKFKVMVKGHKIEIEDSLLCFSCAEKHLNKYSTFCASCEKPIIPGTKVAEAWIGAKYAFTHLTFNCCLAGALYCGEWGEGRIITLHELNPDKYPPGTSSAIAHAINAKQTVVENIVK